MLKIVVFDTGYGGELFADRLEEELPVTKIIRVIDWRNAERITDHPREARKITEAALRPYFDRVDLIIIANYFISATSLNYLRRKYENQKIIGFSLKPNHIATRRPTLILTTKPTARSLAYFNVRWRVRPKTICLDSWPHLIDDGELDDETFSQDLTQALNKINNFSPQQIFLACGQFKDLKPQFREIFGHNARIVDSFEQTIREAYHALSLRTPKI